MSAYVPPWRSARLCRVGSGWKPGYSIMAWPPGWSAHPLPPPKTVQYDLLKGASSRPSRRDRAAAWRWPARRLATASAFYWCRPVGTSGGPVRGNSCGLVTVTHRPDRAASNMDHATAWAIQWHIALPRPATPRGLLDLK